MQITFPRSILAAAGFCLDGAGLLASNTEAMVFAFSGGAWTAAARRSDGWVDRLALPELPFHMDALAAVDPRCDAPHVWFEEREHGVAPSRIVEVFGARHEQASLSAARAAENVVAGLMMRHGYFDGLRRWRAQSHDEFAASLTEGAPRLAFLGRDGREWIIERAEGCVGLPISNHWTMRAEGDAQRQQGTLLSMMRGASFNGFNIDTALVGSLSRVVLKKLLYAPHY